MSNIPTNDELERGNPGTDAHSVQGHIDEKPFWRDGTATAGNPLTRMQWRIRHLATTAQAAGSRRR